uniref:hypothetical protein n=1 Tax=Muriicola sp. TaxID=2020856 RepID=UPI0035647774
PSGIDHRQVRSVVRVEILRDQEHRMFADAEVGLPEVAAVRTGQQDRDGNRFRSSGDLRGTDR